MEAQHNLARLYMTGDGVPEDSAQAVALLQRAAEAGCAPAQFQLGRIYALGDGVPMDTEQAMEWFRRAAAGGDAQALLMLTRFSSAVASDSVTE